MLSLKLMDENHCYIQFNNLFIYLVIQFHSWKVYNICPNNSINYNTVKSLVYCFFVLSLPHNVYKDYKFCKCLYQRYPSFTNMYTLYIYIKSLISHSDVHIVILSCGMEIVPLHVDSYWGSRICSYTIFDS